MKTLGAIIEEVKDGKRPDYEDLRYAVVALQALQCFDMRAITKLAQREKEGTYKAAMFGLQWEAEESFKRLKTALSMPPQEWVGPGHDPDTEECQAFRKMSKKLLKKVEDEMRKAAGDS
jgi:hypothetical protein